MNTIFFTFLSFLFFSQTFAQTVNFPFEIVLKADSIAGFNGLRDYNRTLRLHLRRNGPIIWMDLSAYATSYLTLIIYPDMEIEVFNRRYTIDELTELNVMSPKYYMWND